MESLRERDSEEADFRRRMIIKQWEGERVRRDKFLFDITNQFDIPPSVAKEDLGYVAKNLHFFGPGAPGDVYDVITLEKYENQKLLSHTLTKSLDSMNSS